MSDKAYLLIKDYYDAFNRMDMKTFFSHMDENIIHDINQGKREIGKEKFEAFMLRMSVCYEEKIRDLIVFTNPSGDRAAAEFIVEGIYKKTDPGLPSAKGQKYRLPVGAFF